MLFLVKFKKFVSNFGCHLSRLNELISEGLENGDAEAFVGGNHNQRVLNDSIEDRAFLRSYDSAPRPPSPIGKLSLFLSVPVCRRSSLLTGEEVGREVGRGAKSCDRKKAWPSVNHWILSVDSKENRRGAQERSSLYLLFLGAAGLHTQLHSHPKSSNYTPTPKALSPAGFCQQIHTYRVVYW